MSVIASNLTKNYRLKRKVFKTAVNGISFSIPTGEIVGFVGPNGAGKSTTIKMLTGILTPDGGSVSINGLGYPKDRRNIMLKIGIVFGQKSVLCWDIPVLDTLRLFKDMYGVPDAVYKENMELFSDILGLDEFIGQPPRLLSLGQPTLPPRSCTTPRSSSWTSRRSASTCCPRSGYGTSSLR